MDNQKITIEQVCKTAGVSKHQLYKLVRDEQINSVELARKKRDEYRAKVEGLQGECEWLETLIRHHKADNKWKRIVVWLRLQRTLKKWFGKKQEVKS